MYLIDSCWAKARLSGRMSQKGFLSWVQHRNVVLS